MYGKVLLVLLGIVALIIDRFTKVFAYADMGSWPGYSFLGILTYHPILNTGVAFGLPVARPLLVVITVGIIVALLVYWYRERQIHSALGHTGLYLLIVGALSNAYDRIVQGYVVDFISIPYFAICNVADILISVWVIFLLIPTKKCKQ